MLSGFAGMVGLFCFYTALASGLMGVVAPIASLGLAVPVAGGLVRGEQLSPWQVAGIVAATIGVVCVARVPKGAGGPVGAESGRHRRPVVLAATAAVGFGLALLAIAEGSGTGHGGRAGDVVTTLLAQRAVDVLVAAAALIAMRHRLSVTGLSARATPPLLAVGLIDVGANGLYGYASQHGLVSVVSVLASLYPVVTVLLARWVLRERLVRSQLAGVGATLVGIVLLGTG